MATYRVPWNQQVSTLRRLMRYIPIAIFCFLPFAQSVFGQSGSIEGRVLNKKTKVPIPYANVYNKTLDKGTITNTDGYFRIQTNSETDSVRISFVGFKDQVIDLGRQTSFLTILLEENVLLLGEVTITPQDNSYLFALLKACRKSASNTEKASKAYYELKSTIDDHQVELVEGYYNVDVTGYALKDLHLKAGRVALRPHNDRYFASMESSRAILMLSLMDKQAYFPLNPLAMSSSKSEKTYNLGLESKYVNEKNDSVYVVSYTPKKNQEQFFEGQIWINKSKSQIIKITLNNPSAEKHPFLPLFPSDSISNVSFAITQTYQSQGGEAVFNHIDFVYEIGYKSRIGKTEEQQYTIATSAVLYAYDYKNLFFAPMFDFNDHSTGDYRKINALPYNAFFWSTNDEYRLNDSLNTNASFFSDSRSITNKTLFKKDKHWKRGLFEHAYVQWAPTRIMFREMLPDTSEQSLSSYGIKSEQYNLAVKIYLDINTYQDSTDIATAAIFDPYESYYYLPMDKQTHCFVNMYFDLCEIKRRELEEKIRADGISALRAKEIYESFVEKMEVDNNTFLKAVQRGTIESEMVRYNAYVRSKLGIDNIEMFQPFGTGE